MPGSIDVLVDLMGDMARIRQVMLVVDSPVSGREDARMTKKGTSKASPAAGGAKQCEKGASPLPVSVPVAGRHHQDVSPKIIVKIFGESGAGSFLMMISP